MSTMTTTTEMQSFYTHTPTATVTTHMSHKPAAMDELLTKYSSSMTNSSAALCKKSRNPLRRIVDRVRLEYYRYEVTFGLYVMTPSEKCVANTFVLVVLSLLTWALLLCFPSVLFHKLARLVWLVTGHNGQVSTPLGMMDMHGNPLTTTSVAETPLAS